MELYRIAETRCPRSSGDRALASGARCAGSNPVEGTVALVVQATNYLAVSTDQLSLPDQTR